MADQPPPEPTAAVPPPPPTAMGATPYRQDLSRRVPGPWTRSLQTAIAALFALDAVVSVVLYVAYSSDSRRLAEQQLRDRLNSQGAAVDAAQLQQVLDGVMVIALIGLIVGAAFAILIAVGSYFWRWTWLFWVDVGFLSLGTLFGAVRLMNLAFGNAPARAPQVGWEILSWVAGAAILAWAVLAAVRYGPWGQPLAPAPLEE